MLRINQIKIPVSDKDIVSSTEIKKKYLSGIIAKTLRLPEDSFEFNIARESYDARAKHPLSLVYSVDVTLKNGEASEDKIIKKIKNKDVLKIKKAVYPEKLEIKNVDVRPVIVGMGPAGLFAAYLLTEYGIKPIIIERGDRIENRVKAVNDYWEGKPLNKNTNVQFGEGGAGTFSDGKLNTSVKDKVGRQEYVLKTFVKHGAPEDIMYKNRPHIGTDYLRTSITSMREELIKRGTDIYYNTTMTGINVVEENGRKRVASVDVVNNDTDSYIKPEAVEGCLKDFKTSIDKASTIPCSALILAIGHSSRDTFRYLNEHGIDMECKNFAVGVRIEHPRELINKLQYHEHTGNINLPTAYYKLTYQDRTFESVSEGIDSKDIVDKAGRPCFTFCMCPGGYVVNAASEDGRIVVNGMSNYDRMAENSNSAVIVGVTKDDFEGDDCLAGLRFQERLEENAYRIGEGRVPIQLFKDFEDDKASTEFGVVKPCHMGEVKLGNIREGLPEFISSAIIDAIHFWDNKMPGFAREDALLSGYETRTSSPVKIIRDEHFESNVSGLYPTGEGAGYAGGIMSAAMDGLKVAEEIIKTMCI